MSEQPAVTIYRITSGNVVGVIEQPEDPDPNVSMHDQRMVRIGVLDPVQGLDKDDALNVTQRLKQHIQEVLPDSPASRPERFAFQVTREGDAATIMTDLGNNVIRSRIMPVAMLQKMSEACSQLIDVAQAEKDSPEKLNGLPQFPKCAVLAEGTIGDVCKFHLTATSLEDDTVEFTVAFYDAEDDSAPVLVLAEEQMEDFTNIVARLT